jgi:hypothetical protein
MQEQIIKYETAVLAKEKGFDEKCSKVYVNDGYLRDYHMINLSMNVINLYSAPTQALLQKWLREVHSIYVDVNSIVMLRDSKRLFGGNVNGNFKPLSSHIISCSYPTYEEALEQALIESLKMINK